MPRAAKPTRLPGGGGISMTTEPDFFVKQGDFQALAAGRPMLYYREPSKALVDWERGWREFFLGSFPASVEAIDAAVGWTGDATGSADADDADAGSGDGTDGESGTTGD